MIFPFGFECACLAAGITRMTAGVTIISSSGTSFKKSPEIKLLKAWKDHQNRSLPSRMWGSKKESRLVDNPKSPIQSAEKAQTSATKFSDLSKKEAWLPLL